VELVHPRQPLDLLPHARALTLAAALALAPALSCRAGDPPRPCPARFAPDPARASLLVVLLRTAPEGASILDRFQGAPASVICFGPSHRPGLRADEPPYAPGPMAVSSITTEGTVLLDRELGEREAAARLGHLLDHAVEGMPMAHPRAGGCDAQVEEALAQEARALAIELRLRRALGVAGPRIAYAFEDAFWRAPAEAREPLVLDYLRAHPDGAPGLDALASGYARRCREAR
jgi:hypothetical protein